MFPQLSSRNLSRSISYSEWMEWGGALGAGEGVGVVVDKNQRKDMVHVLLKFT